MTIVRGVRIIAAPCCGAQYAFPRYVSMNFSAFEYWTDGWREWSLMPNDEGLRRCKCGQFVLSKGHGLSRENRSTQMRDDDEQNDLPHMDHVPDDLLPECIAQRRAARTWKSRQGWVTGDISITSTVIDTVSTEMLKKPQPKRHGK
jgi:hypothetical protein